MAEEQFGMRELLELKDKQIQQLKKELDDTKELVLELSESELILQEAQNVRQEAQEERKAARKERETAAHYIQDGKQERQLYADTKAKIDQEKADWNKIKKDYRDKMKQSLEVEKAALAESAKKDVQERIKRFKAVLIILLVYSLAATGIMLFLFSQLTRG